MKHLAPSVVAECRPAPDAGCAGDELQRRNPALLRKPFGNGIGAHAIRPTHGKLLKGNERIARELAIHPQHHGGVLRKTLQALKLHGEFIELARGAEPAHEGCSGRYGCSVVRSQRVEQIVEAVRVGESDSVDAAETRVDALPLRIEARRRELVVVDHGRRRLESGALHVERKAETCGAQPRPGEVVPVGDLIYARVALALGRRHRCRDGAHVVCIREVDETQRIAGAEQGNLVVEAAVGAVR